MSKIAVIGAGPAGYSAGYHLASSGHNVTLIDKHCFPKDKVCGDGISLESIQDKSHFEADLRAGLQIKAFRKFSLMNYLLIWLMKQNPRVAQQVSHAVAEMTKPIGQGTGLGLSIKSANRNRAI